MITYVLVTVEEKNLVVYIFNKGFEMCQILNYDVDNFEITDIEKDILCVYNKNDMIKVVIDHRLSEMKNVIDKIKYINDEMFKHVNVDVSAC